MSSFFFIFGFGYTAQVLANKLSAQGFSVIGTTRKVSTKQSMASKAITLIDFNSPDIEGYLNQATHLLISVPPIHLMGDCVLAQYGDLIKKQAPRLHWLGYLSSTGVYGDHQGRWVDEDTACTPNTPSGIARLQAEKAWLSFATAHQLPLHLFRLSGIYGPGRNALERIVHGKHYSTFKEGQVFCRIHVDDIAMVLLASINSINPLSVYNVSDDVPEASHLVDSYATSLLKREPLPVIPFLNARLSPMEQAFYSNNRRVSNLKIKNELHIKLQYPSFREGLTQLWLDAFASTN